MKNSYRLPELTMIHHRAAIIAILIFAVGGLILFTLNDHLFINFDESVQPRLSYSDFNFTTIERRESHFAFEESTQNAKIQNGKYQIVDLKLRLKTLRHSLKQNLQPGCVPRLDDYGPEWPSINGHYMSSEEYYHYLLEIVAPEMFNKLNETSATIDPTLFAVLNRTSVNDLDKSKVVEYAQEAYWAAVHLHCRIHREDALHNFDWRSVRAKHSLPFIGGQNPRFTADHLFESGNRYIDVTKVKPGDVVYVMMIELPLFLTLFHPNITSPYVILSHSEDDSAPTAKYAYILNDKKLLAWFTINYDLGYEEQVPKVPSILSHEGKLENLPKRHRKLYPIILGVQNQVFGEKEHALSFETLRFLTWYQVPRERRPYLLSLRFTPSTQISRVGLFEQFQNFSNDTLVVTKRQSHIDYYLTMSQSQFVLSPPGHGQDCHRIIEAILMGAIPIVLKTMPMDTLFDRSVFGDYDEEGFSASWPVLRVNKYDEVTPEFLRQWKPASENYVGRKPAFLRYWVEKIRHVAASRLDEYYLDTRGSLQ